MAGHSDYIDASELSLDELRAAVFGESERWSPALALSLLSTRDYPQKARDLERVLVEEEDGRLSLMAVDELGRLGTPEAVEALTRAVSRSGPRIRRAAALSLAATGPLEARTTLGRFRRTAEGDESDTRAAEWSAQLHALRFHQPLERQIVTRDTRTVSVREGDAEPVAVEPLPEREGVAVLDGLRRSSLRVDVTARGSKQLRCGRYTYAVVPAAELLAGRRPEALLDSPAILAVVAQRDDVETDEWATRYLVVSQPTGERSAVLALVTPDGRLTMAGKARTDGTLAFELRTVDGPGRVAVDCAGEVGDGQVRFDRLLSEQRVRQRGKAPLPVEEGEARG